jgi:hypothetical protein
MPVLVTEGASETRARHEMPVLTSLGLRAAAAGRLPESRAASLRIPQSSVREVGPITSIGLERQRRDQRRCRERSPRSDAIFRPRPAPLGGLAQWR